MPCLVVEKGPTCSGESCADLIKKMSNLQNYEKHDKNQQQESTTNWQ